MLIYHRQREEMMIININILDFYYQISNKIPHFEIFLLVFFSNFFNYSKFNLIQIYCNAFVLEF